MESRNHRWSGRTTHVSSSTHGMSGTSNAVKPEHEPVTASTPATSPGKKVSAATGHADTPPNLTDSTERDRNNSLSEFNSLSITEILDQDSRPTFVIDLDLDRDAPPSIDGISPLFCNSALRLHERLCDTIAGEGTGINDVIEDHTSGFPTYDDFRNWVLGVTKFDDSKDIFPLSFFFADLLWTGSTVRKRWRLISGNLCSHCIPSRAPTVVSCTQSREPYTEQASEKSSSLPRTSKAPTRVSDANIAASTFDWSSSQKLSDFSRSESRSSRTSLSSQSKLIALTKAPEKSVIDWTSPTPKGLLSAHHAIARAVRWDATPLGPMEKWSPELCQVANLVMANPHPATLCWGSDLTMLYNEGYANIIGHKHPRLMGTGFSGPFFEIWDALAADFAECARTGVSICKTDDHFPIERHGFVEETYYSWSWTPLYGGTDQIVGFYNASFDTTSTVLRQRRMHTINKIGGNFARAKSMKQFWSLLLQALEDNERDIPFALLYSVGEGDGDGIDQESISSESTMSSKSCYFEGALGIPDVHAVIHPQLDLKRSLEGFVPAFREAMLTREPTLVRTSDGTLPEQLLNGIRWRGHGDPCSQAVIFPVRPTNGDLVMAFLVLGVNPRRPYDEEYKEFTNMLNRQFATSLASFMLYEEEVHRNKNAAEAAALESQQLTQELILQTNRLRRMTELSPLGMYLFNSNGIILEANDRWYDMTGHPRDEYWEKSFLQVVDDSSQKAVEAGWERLTVERLPWTCELQLKKLTVRPLNLNGEDIEYWVLVTAHPEIGPDGSLRSIMGSLTEISHLKWAQGLQNRRLMEAEETRRQQNEFIDITSHEMRNPLSAILQCADDIMTTLENRRSSDNPPTSEDLKSCLEAAHTISLCVQHQKSIVDDILTVSKLDSNLLVITPVPAQPIEVVMKAVKMFDPELQAKDIQMICETHASMESLEIDWLTFDPSRVLQILLNLITNAIKFTAGCPKRIIKVIISAYREPPLVATTPNFQYIPARTVTSHAASGEDQRTGEFLYLGVKVKDSGCGLTQEEMKRLFERFSQASPRTHAQYGGSGLGLFISRQLTELQGGQIGVASEAGTGSTFGFYVKAKRSSPPPPGKSPNLLPFEREIDAAASLTQPVAPQRQGLASPSLIEELVATKAKATPEFDPRGLEVLVVEDNLVNQKVLVKQLKKFGLGVGVANDGIEALAYLEGTAFRQPLGKKLSVILMDLEMPNMDGLTCVREIRKMEMNGDIVRHVPVIAVTANVRDEQLSAARRSGMNDVMSKPFRIPDLLKKIEALLSSIDTGTMVSDVSATH